MIPINTNSAAPKNFDAELFTTLLYPCLDWWLDVHCGRLLQHIETLAPTLSLDSNVDVGTLRNDLKRSLETLSADSLPTVVRLEAGLHKTRPESAFPSIAFSIWLRSLPDPEKTNILCLTPYEKPRPELKIKTLNSHNILRETFSVREDIQKQGYTDALWVNSQGHLTETSTANFFVFKNTPRIALYTPPTSLCLPGTVRNWLFNTAEALNMAVHETPLTWEALSQEPQAYSGAFITNAVRGIIPVDRLFNPNTNESLAFPEEAFTELYRTLRQHWRAAGLRFAADYVETASSAKNEPCP